ncbi:MAG: hypothetical protein SOT71_04045 [Romboutsia timonensis]|uniref:hypothetical protein n=1 Tax=Romboutsia timonensis TaxID=1776391 RepID=UPI002A761458|nr:hypothetical protein [Romboutsia timonensis]MDY2881810.1 hypothetical protein [Romboutsia timonensis]
MNKYKRIYEEKAEGELELVGLIKEGETIKVIKDLTPQQKAIINNKKELNTYSKKLGGFLHVCYVKNQLLFNTLNLNQATISRFLYLATYIDYNDREENVLIKHTQNNKLEYLTKRDIRNLLNLSEKTFYDFMKEVKEKELLFEANNKIYLNPVYVNKGRSNFRNKEYTRMFIDTTKELYENCTSRQHKRLSYIYQLLPFLNYESNILCNNPEEKDINKLDKLSFKDICGILGLSKDKKSMNTLKKDLFKFYITKDNKKYYFFSYVTIKQENGSESYYVVNPLVIWKGSDLQVAKDIIGLLMINKN